MSDELLSQLEKAAENESALSLPQLTELAELALQYEAEVADSEQVTKDRKAKLNKIILELLPKAMRDAKVPKFVCGNHEVALKEEMTCSVPKDRKEDIIAKLKSPEFAAGDMVSNVLTIELGKDSDEAAAKLAKFAEELGLSVTRTEDVKTASLKALLARRMKAGKNDDLSFFGAYNVTKAKIK